MDESTNGELPLHPRSVTSSNFTYADYWKSLSTSFPPHFVVEDKSAHYIASPQLKHATAHVDDSQKNAPEACSAAYTPRRFIHAATSAYRLCLSHSPNPNTSSRTPLSKRDPIEQWPKKNSNVAVKGFEAQHATQCSGRSLRDENTPVEERAGTACVASPFRDSISPLGAGRSESDAPPSDVKPTLATQCSKKERLLFAEDISERPTVSTADDYVPDAQVLQAVRCYEEWRHWLCAGNADETWLSPSTSKCKASAPMSKANERIRPVRADGDSKVEDEKTFGTPPAIGLSETTPGDTALHSSEIGGGDIEINFSPGTTPSPHTHKQASGAQHVTRLALSSSTPPPARRNSALKALLLSAGKYPAVVHSSSPSPMNVTGGGIRNKNGSVRSNDTHGLSNGRAEKTSGDDTSSTAARTSSAAAASDASPPSFRSNPWVWVASPDLQFPSVLPCSTQEEPQGLQQTHLRMKAPEEERLVAAGKPASYCQGDNGCCDVREEHQSEEASLFSKKKGSEIEASAEAENPERALPRISSVQRKLFSESDDDDAEPDTSSLKMHFTATKPDSLVALNDAPPVETLIELSCMSSSGGNEEVNIFSNTEGESDDVLSAIEPEDYARSSLQLSRKSEQKQCEEEEEQQQRPQDSSNCTSSDPRAYADNQVNLGQLQQNKNSQNTLLDHPLYQKQHAAVSALYAGRLLDSEVHNDELQLFLCWAQEKAERQMRRWQPDTVPMEKSSVEGVDAPSLSFTPLSVIQSNPPYDTSAFTIKPAVQALYRRAYAHPLKSRPLCVQAATKASNAAATAQLETSHPRTESITPLCHPAVYVALPAASVEGAQPSTMDEGKWLTPASINSRFITWIARDVDVYEGLVM